MHCPKGKCQLDVKRGRSRSKNKNLTHDNFNEEMVVYDTLTTLPAATKDITENFKQNMRNIYKDKCLHKHPNKVMPLHFSSKTLYHHNQPISLQKTSSEA